MHYSTMLNKIEPHIIVENRLQKVPFVFWGIRSWSYRFVAFPEMCSAAGLRLPLFAIQRSAIEVLRIRCTVENPFHGCPCGIPQSGL
jgi:hypothetical protein